MLQPDFDPAPTEVCIHRCGYVSRCKARGCPERATLIAEKTDAMGRHVRQIELCPLHCEVVIARERVRGLEIWPVRLERWPNRLRRLRRVRPSSLFWTYQHRTPATFSYRLLPLSEMF
jgi:hypothetical protein